MSTSWPPGRVRPTCPWSTPRRTGDGYYEAVLLDPEGNRVEIVAGDYTDEVAERPGP